MMKKGDVINGYRLTTDAQNGGGQCEWAFAKKDGEAFFIKRFLKPVYPMESSPGSPETKAEKRARSDEFERQQRQIIRKLREISGEGGNLVVTREFFRESTHFYKVTLKVDVTHISPREIAGLPRDDRILIMLTAAKSLETLHRAGLVHGDVKLDNLLVKALPGGGHAIKVIDFDNCFPVNHPAPADQLVGDIAFYSPELYLYHLGEGSGGALDDKTDVFALGLVFWQYLTGERPPLPPGRRYSAQAVLGGTSLSLPKSIRDMPVADVIHAMLAQEPGARPSMSEVHSGLRNARKGRPIRLAPREPARPADISGKLRLPADKPPESARPADKPGLKGRLFRKRPAGAAEGVGGKPFGGKLFGSVPGPAMGFAPPSDGDPGAAMPDGPVIGAAPPGGDAPGGDAPPGGGAAEGAGSRLGGTLWRKAAAGEGDAPGSAGTTEVKLGGTLIRKTAAAGEPPDRSDAKGARSADGPDAVERAESEKEIEPGDGDGDAATEEPTVDSKLRSSLRKRRE
jgi:eukaryotic-like serine/threonine-protein kinase